MFDYIQQKVKEGMIKDVENCTESEFRDCLVLLEQDGIISQVGHRLTPTIRFLK